MSADQPIENGSHQTKESAPPTASESDQTLSREGQYILDSWKEFQKEQYHRATDEIYEVSDVFGFVAYIYEKIRAAVENKDEHLLRRYAIQRALNRLELYPLTEHERSERLIKELTWSRFLSNATVSRGTLQKITRILTKYHQLQNSALEQSKESKLYMRDWILSIASTEIEETLTPSFLRRSLVPTMYAWLKSRYSWRETELTAEQLEIQLFIAAHRALAKADIPILRYHLFILLHPEWEDASSTELDSMSAHLPNIIKHIDELLSHPYKNVFFRFAQKNTAPFLLLELVLKTTDKPDELFHNPQQLITRLHEVANATYAQIKTKVNQGIIRSILYILATKVIIAFLVEYPYELYIVGDINTLALAINLLFPPLLMFLMAQTIKVPNTQNTDRIFVKLQSLIYEQEDKKQPVPARLHIARKQSRLSQIFSIIYVYIFIITLLTVAYFLMSTLHFNIVSTGLFFMFLSLVLLFGFRLKWQAQELLVAEPKQGILQHMFSIVSIPFINVGVWLSSSLSQINILTFLLDKIIDAPLKSGVNSAEEWTKFLKSKQQEVVEVPRD